MIRPTSELIANQLRRPIRQETDERLIAIGAAARSAKASWWGVITVCDVAGTGKARRVSGTYPDFEVVGEAPEVDVILGAYPPCRAGSYGHFVSSGSGVTPGWTLNQHIQVGFREPDATELAPTQDDGGGLRSSCGD